MGEEDKKTSKPMYEQIYDVLNNQIISGHYGEGDRVPSEKELAESYNVSRITSKKALELLAAAGLIIRLPGKGSFVKGKEDTAEKEALEQSRQQKGAPSLLGLVITDFDYSYGTRIVHGAEEASRENNCFLVLRRTLGVFENEVDAIKELQELGVDGLIVFPAHGEFFNEELLKLIIDKFPLVLIDRHLKGVAAASISTDNVKAALQGTQHLFELEHRNIGILTPPPRDTTAIEGRIEGFIEAHAAQGVVVNRDFWITDITSTLPNAFRKENIEADVDRIKKHIVKYPEITALFAVEYNIALLAKRAVQELQLKVPEDISIISFDSPELDFENVFKFTHLKQKEKEMGRMAIENILKLKEGLDISNRQLLDAELIIGESTKNAKK
ncbi:substrate-binding domain-containing protein [Bacillus sp. FSL K6-3431]|uniref:substrate-binding domain-containing protein n=1 Tax=Bacillus sp. FSL K6-3431 TaxID=2921500 RepID=UPI0030FB29CE